MTTNQVTIIADPGSCWKVSPNEPLDLGWDRMRRLMDSTKAAAAQVFKPQFYRADLMYPQGSKEHALLSGYEYPEEWLPAMKAECDDRGLTFMATIYHPTHVPLLDPLIATWKVASFESENLPLLRAIGEGNKPVLLSNGASKEPYGTDEAWKALGHHKITVLHCVSSYPAKPEQMNLSVLIGRNFECETGLDGRPERIVRAEYMGLSDHTVGHTAAVMAVALGASVIEKHVKAFDSGNGPDAHFAAGPATFANYCSKVRLAESMLGTGEKAVMEGEATHWRYDAATGRRGTA